MARRLFEDGAAPEQRARRVAAAALVELGELLVGLEARHRIGGLAGARHQRLDEVAGAVTSEGGAVDDDRREQLLARRHGHAGAAGRALEIAAALEIERGLEREAGGLGGGASAARSSRHAARSASGSGERRS